MYKRKVLAGVLLIGVSVGFIGYQKNVLGLMNKGEGIKIIKDTKDIKATKTADVKVDRYDNMSGIQWIDEDNIIISKLNKELPSIKIDTKTLKADFGMNNIYTYNLDSKNKKIIGNELKYTEDGVVSPHQKHILYTNEYQKDVIGYISDTNGNVVTKISDSDISTYDLKNASWIDDKHVIIPCHNIDGFAIISIDGNIQKIKNVEKSGNEQDLDALSMIKPIKVGDKIYYTKIHRDKKEDNKLMVYDTKTKEKKMLIKDDVLEFRVSNDNNQIAAIVYNGNKNIHELTIMNLDGSKRKIVAEGAISSMDWSKDGKKIAYTSYEEYENGVYAVNIDTNEKILIVKGNSYYNVEYSPSGRKLMFNSTIEVPEKNSNSEKLFPEQMSVMNIISFKN